MGSTLERRPVSFAKHTRDQVPTLNKMKQQLHQLSVSFAQITNEALMAWDPQLEYKLYLMQEQLLLLKKNEDVLSFDGSLEDETKSDFEADYQCSSTKDGNCGRKNHSPMHTSSSSTSSGGSGNNGRRLQAQEGVAVEDMS